MSIRGYIYKTPMVNGKIDHDSIIPFPCGTKEKPRRRDDFMSYSSEEDLCRLIEDISRGSKDTFVINYDAMDRLKEKYRKGKDKKVINKYMKQLQFLDNIVKQYGQVYIECY